MSACWRSTSCSPVVRVWPVRGMTLEWARAEFDRMLRPIVLQALGWQALHAGAALTSEGALLFCGRSGAGKSTTAYALGKMGWTQLADDQVVWRLHDGRPKVQALPFTPRLRPLSQARFADRASARAPWPASQGLIPMAAIHLLDQCANGRPPVSNLRESQRRRRFPPCCRTRIASTSVTSMRHGCSPTAI